jgi:very-short-patch-repair endonuclease
MVETRPETALEQHKRVEEMRRPFSRSQLAEQGLTPASLRTGLANGTAHRVGCGVFVSGVAPPTVLDRALGLLVATNGTASHALAGVLHGLDGIKPSLPFVTVPLASRRRRTGLAFRNLPSERVSRVRGFRCTDGLQTLVDLAGGVDDLVWEQVLESALRKQLTTIDEIEAVLPDLGRARRPGVTRIRRVLALRPAGAPPTESLLETFMVQLIRSDSTLPSPTRQVEVRNEFGDFVARVDLAYPSLGVFLELDGQHHQDQPVYDAVRQTAVVAAKKWLPGRFTWDDITRRRRLTLHRLRQLLLGG